MQHRPPAIVLHGIGTSLAKTCKGPGVRAAEAQLNYASCHRYDCSGHDDGGGGGGGGGGGAGDSDDD